MRFAVLLVVIARVASAQPTGDLAKEFQAGVDAFRLGKWAEARAHLERARDLDPKLPGPFRFLAAVSQAEGKWAECIADAREALRLNPQSSEAADTRKLHDQCRASAGKTPYRGDPLGDSAAIAVTSNVPGATVKIGGLTMGGTPMAPRPITAGKLEIEVDKLGWKSAKSNVEALPGIVTDVDLELEPDPTAQAPVTKAENDTVGYLRLPAEMASLEVLVDDKLARSRALPPGTHVIEIRSNDGGFDPWRRRVRVVAGAEIAISPILVHTAAREHTEHIGLAFLAASGALVLGGFSLALVSEHAANAARDIQRVETARDPTQPLSATAAVEPVRTRADFDAARSRASTYAIASDISYAAALAASTAAAIFLYRGARERTDIPPPFAIAPTRGGALVAKELAW